MKTPMKVEHMSIMDDNKIARVWTVANRLY